MEKPSSPECSIENKNAGFSMVEEPKAAEIQLHLLPPEWRRLRICHPDLVFTQDTFFTSNTVRTTNSASIDTEFVTKVDDVLRPFWSTSTTTTVTLDKFVVKFTLRKKHKDHIDRWIRFSIASRAKHIAIDCAEYASSLFGCDEDKYVFPVSDLSGSNGSCVKHLQLGYVCLKLPSSFCGITSLKKLTLNMVSINAGDLECLLLTCPLLESLSLEFCSLSSLSIRQDLCRLKDLRLRYCYPKVIELHASNLTRIEFDDHLNQIVLTECFKLSEATFVSNRRSLPYNSYAFSSTFTELPAVIPHVHKLFLLLSIDQVLTFSENQTKFVNLRHLNMNIRILSYRLRNTSLDMGVVNLLDLAPLLEELELHLSYDTRYISASRIATAAQGPLHRHLKSVYMTGFSGVSGLAELALYILGNATALKRMVVDPAGDDIYSVSKGGSSQEHKNYINRKRKFAEKNLNREEFRHILTILKLSEALQDSLKRGMLVYNLNDWIQQFVHPKYSGPIWV